MRSTAHCPIPPAPAAPGAAGLSTRERELVTLLGQGCTDADIAAQLYISIRTVRSHLDRIRDKTGCRRRADLTRLALSQGLVWPDLPSAHLWVVLPRPPQRRQKG
jgi:DNA-binding CsgD family transcriptional regulator